MKVNEIKGADFSEDKLYRYSLWRVWDEALPLVMFVGLNPSTANGETDDPTIRRCRSIAKNLGYGGFYMCNCFSYISTNPDMLKAETLDAAIRNATIMRRVADSCASVIFAWGNFPIVAKSGIDKKLSEAFPKALALHINKNGSPKHPLYCKSDIVPVLYNPDRLCPNCKDNVAGESAPCPYGNEIHCEEKPCRCCNECRNICLAEI